MFGQSAFAGVVVPGSAEVGEVVVVAAAAAAAVAGGVAVRVGDGAVALVGVDVADAPRDPAESGGTDFPGPAVDGEDVQVGHCAVAVGCTEVDSHTVDADRRSVGAPARGAEAQGQTGLGENPLAAVENTGDSAQLGMTAGMFYP